MESNFTFWVLALAVVLNLALIIYFIYRSKSSNEKWKHIVVVLFGLSMVATVYLLFSPAGGLYSGTASLWDYWTNDAVRLFSFLASEKVAAGLALRKILIWPCFIADAICIYAYINLRKKSNSSKEEPAKLEPIKEEPVKEEPTGKKQSSISGYIALGVIVILIIVALAFKFCGGTGAPGADKQEHSQIQQTSTSTTYKVTWTLEQVSAIKSTCKWYTYNQLEGWVAWWTPDGYLRFMTTNDSEPKVLHSPNPNEPCKTVYSVTENKFVKLICIDHVIPTPDSSAFILFYPSTPEFFEMNETPYRLLSFPSLNMVKFSEYDSLGYSNFVSTELAKDITDYKESKWGEYKLVYRSTVQYNTKGEIVYTKPVSMLYVYGTDYWFELIEIPSAHLDNYYYKKALIRIFDSFLVHIGNETYQIDKATQQCIKDIQHLEDFNKEWDGIDDTMYPVWELEQKSADEKFEDREEREKLDKKIDDLEKSLDELDKATDALDELLILDLL